MARVLNKLSDMKVRKLTKPGRYGDGGLLVLNIGPAGNKSWLLRYRNRATGKIVESGLGSVADVPLKVARERAAEARALLAAGGDPLADKKRKRFAAAMASASLISLADCVEKYAASLELFEKPLIVDV